LTHATTCHNARRHITSTALLHIPLTSDILHTSHSFVLPLPHLSHCPSVPSPSCPSRMAAVAAEDTSIPSLPCRPAHSSNGSHVPEKDTHRSIDPLQRSSIVTKCGVHVSLTLLRTLADSDTDLLALTDGLLELWRLNTRLTSYVQFKRDAVMDRYGLVGSTDETGTSEQRGMATPDSSTYEERLAALMQPFPMWPLKCIEIPLATSYKEGRAEPALRGASSMEGGLLLPVHVHVNEGLSSPSPIATRPVQGDTGRTTRADVTSMLDGGDSALSVPALESSRSQDSSQETTSSGSFSTASSSQKVDPTLSDPTSGSLSPSLWHRAKRWLTGHRKPAASQ